MAKYTLEEIMCGEKYNIESDVFMAAYELVKQGIRPKDIREQLREFYVREAIKTTIKLIREIYKPCLEDIFLLKMRGVNYE